MTRSYLTLKLAVSHKIEDEVAYNEVSRMNFLKDMCVEVVANSVSTIVSYPFRGKYPTLIRSTSACAIIAIILYNFSVYFSCKRASYCTAARKFGNIWHIAVVLLLLNA